MSKAMPVISGLKEYVVALDLTMFTLQQINLLKHTVTLPGLFTEDTGELRRRVHMPGHSSLMPMLNWHTAELLQLWDVFPPTHSKLFYIVEQKMVR